MDRHVSGYALCPPYYAGLALVGAPNAWTHRLLDVLKRIGSGNALNHCTNIVCSPYMGVRQLGDAPSYTLCPPYYEGLALHGSRRAQCLGTPPA